MKHSFIAFCLAAAVAMFGWLGPLIGLVTALFALLWGLAWPVFCLIWLGRARVRGHYETWGVAG